MVRAFGIGSHLRSLLFDKRRAYGTHVVPVTGTDVNEALRNPFVPHYLLGTVIRTPSHNGSRIQPR